MIVKPIKDFIQQISKVGFYCDEQHLVRTPDNFEKITGVTYYSHPSSNIGGIYTLDFDTLIFKSEEDLTMFLLRWS